MANKPIRGIDNANAAVFAGNKKYPHIKWCVIVVEDDKAAVMAKIDGRKSASVMNGQYPNIDFIVDSLAMSLREGK